MGGHHDIGGREEGPIDRTEYEPSLYERRADAMAILLVARGIYTLDAARRVAEWDLSESEYRTIRYYDRWLVQAQKIMIERGLLSEVEIAAKRDAVRARVAAERAQALALPIAERHDHDHADDPHALDDDGGRPLNEYEILEETLRELFIAKGFFSADDVRRQVEDMETRTPAQGARFIARIWTDPVFRELARADTRSAIAQLGIDMTKAVPIKIVENTPAQHHVVVARSVHVIRGR
jgi:hypothetical protein